MSDRDPENDADGSSQEPQQQSPPGERKPLLPQHAAMIRGSAISDDVAAARGYWSATTPEDLIALGFHGYQARVPALVVPIWSIDPRIVMHQIRPDEPRLRDGKPVKYETPVGARLRIDIPSRARGMIGDPSIPLYITEGVRKGDSAASKDLCCIDLLGVWGWRGTNDHGGKVILPDWDSIALNGRTVYVVFDSDVMQKGPVQLALERLKAFLESRGAKVNLVYLPSGPDGAKTGLDDYFAQGHGTEELLTLATDELRESQNREGDEDSEAEDEKELEEARDLLAEIETMSSAEEVFDTSVIARLALLSRRDQINYGLAKSRMEKTLKRALRMRDLEGAVRAEVRRQEDAKRRARNSREWGNPRALFPEADLSEALTMPAGFVVGEGGALFKVSERETKDGPIETRTKISEAAVFVVGRCIDLADRGEKLRLKYQRGDQFREITSPRERVFDRPGIVALSKCGFPSNSWNAGALIEYTAAHEAANLTALPVSHVSSSMGWIHDERGEILGFMAGREWIPAKGGLARVDFQASDAGDEQVVRSIQSAGTIDGWREALRLAVPFPRVAVATVAALASPLLHLLGTRNFGVDWSGQTSIGKTTCLRFASSAWGVPEERRPDSYITTWDSTHVHLERRCSLMTGLPQVVDETKSARKPEEVERAIYTSIIGHGRGRGSPDGLRRFGAWETVLLTSGESPITFFTTAGGTRARILSLRGSPFGPLDAVRIETMKSLNRLVLAHHGHAGPAFIRWIVGHLADLDRWRETFRSLVGHYLDIAASNPVAARFADVFGVLHVTAELASGALALPWRDPASSIESLWGSVMLGAEEADVAAASLRYVYAWSQRYEHTFHGREEHAGSGDGERVLVPSIGWSGRWDRVDWTFLGILETTLRKILSEGGYDWGAVETWRERAWLDTDPGKLTKRVRVDGGERVYVYAITRDALRSVGVGEGADEGDE